MESNENPKKTRGRHCVYCVYVLLAATLLLGNGSLTANRKRGKAVAKQNRNALNIFGTFLTQTKTDNAFENRQ